MARFVNPPRVVDEILVRWPGGTEQRITAYRRPAAARLADAFCPEARRGAVAGIVELAATS